MLEGNSPITLRPKGRVGPLVRDHGFVFGSEVYPYRGSQNVAKMAERNRNYEHPPISTNLFVRALQRIIGILREL